MKSGRCQVLVLESHDIPGGAAHSWVQKGYHFESGPSLYSDMASTGEQIFSEFVHKVKYSLVEA